MGALSALSTAFDALRRNPVLLAATFIAALVGSTGYLAQGVSPIASIVFGLASFAISIFVTPFITAGTLGMSEEAIAGRTRFETFLRAGKSNYLSMLGAHLLFIGTILALTLVFVVLTVIIGVTGAFAMGSGGGAGIAGMGLGLGVLLFVLLFFLGMLTVVFFLQFYDVAVVVSDEGATGSLPRSASFVRHHLLGVLGYSMIYMFVTLIASIPAVWLSVSTANFSDPASPAAMAGPSLVELLPVVLATLVLSTVVSAFLFPYKVAFYGSESGELGESGESSESGTSGEFGATMN